MTFARPEWEKKSKWKTTMQTLQQTLYRPKKIDNLSRGGKIDVDIKTQKKKKQHIYSRENGNRNRFRIAFGMETFTFTVCLNAWHSTERRKNNDNDKGEWDRRKTRARKR